MATDKSVNLHLGLGAFHRAHQAVYMQKLHDLGDESWVLAGTDVRPDQPQLLSALQKQKGAFTLETVSPDGKREYTSIKSIRQVIPFDPKLTQVVDLGSQASTRIVSFTVTEGGYYLTPQNDLDCKASDVANDLAQASSDGRSATIYGVLTKILRARLKANAQPITLLSCDNLRHNGDRSRKALLQFLEQLGDKQLLDYVRSSTSSPNCMVDRITPRPTPEVAARVKKALGIEDPAALMGESFIQWVVEDTFVAGRPAWERVGVEIVKSVLPYEDAKIRILNSSHSCIAWGGVLFGLKYIHEATTHPVIHKWAYNYVTNDVIPLLEQAGTPIDLKKYRDVVLSRFCNEAILDTNQRVVADSWSKISVFIRPTIEECLDTNRSIDSVAFLPAVFLEFLKVWEQGKLPFKYQDPAMPEAVARAIVKSSDPVAALCADKSLWGKLANDPRLVKAIRSANTAVIASLPSTRA
jgi:D-arabinitol 4-dehydrogenase